MHNEATPLCFEEIYDEWFGTIARWVLKLGVRPGDQEDMVQEIFTVAYRRLADFDGGNLAGWLYQIARRKVRDYRGLAWVRQVHTPETTALLESSSGTLGPLDELETKRKSEWLSRLLAQLPSNQRAVFLQFELEGYSGREIAERERVPLNTVWLRLHRARQKLQRRTLPTQDGPLPIRHHLG